MADNGAVPEVHLELEGTDGVCYVIVFNSSEKETNSAKTDVLKAFIQKIKDKGISVRFAESLDTIKRHYILLTADEDVLSKKARQQNLLVFLRTGEDSQLRVSERVRGWFLPILQSSHVKCVYDERFVRLIRGEGQEQVINPLTFSRIKCLLIHDIIKDIEVETPAIFGDVASVKYKGLEWLKEKGIIEKSFALHNDEERRVLRRKLREKVPTFLQAITCIRDYFGEKVAFTFAWRTAWVSWGLTIPAVVAMIYMVYLWVTEGNPLLVNSPSLPFYITTSTFLQMVLLNWGWPRYKFRESFKWGMLNYFFQNERKLVSNLKLADRGSVFNKFITGLGFAGILVLLVVYNGILVWLRHKVIPQYRVFGAIDITNSLVSVVNTVLFIFLFDKLIAKMAKLLCDYQYHTFPSGNFDTGNTMSVDDVMADPGAPHIPVLVEEVGPLMPVALKSYFIKSFTLPELKEKLVPTEWTYTPPLYEGEIKLSGQIQVYDQLVTAGMKKVGLAFSPLIALAKERNDERITMALLSLCQGIATINYGRRIVMLQEGGHPAETARKVLKTAQEKELFPGDEKKLFNQAFSTLLKEKKDSEGTISIKRQPAPSFYNNKRYQGGSSYSGYNRGGGGSYSSSYSGYNRGGSSTSSYRGRGSYSPYRGAGYSRGYSRGRGNRGAGYYRGKY